MRNSNKAPFSWLIPGVLQVHAAALRMSCASNLRQIALGVRTFHDENHRLPYNTFGGHYGSGPDSKAWSWLARTLPYIEQDALHRAGGIPHKTLRESGIAGQEIALFVCPADPGAGSGFRHHRGRRNGDGRLIMALPSPLQT